MPVEWDSATYQRVSNPQLEWGREVLARLELRGDETVLDAGCGPGRVTAELLDRLPRGRVVALDVSLNMMREAKKLLKARFGPHIGFVQADLVALPFRERFDGIFSTATFHWVQDHQRLFYELFAALKPGGWLDAQCGGGWNLRRHRQHALALMNKPKYEPYFRGWREPWEYAEALTTGGRLMRAGFTKIETSLRPAPTQLPDPASFAEFVRTVTLKNHLAPLPEELRKEFVNEITQLAANEDPPFMLDYWRLNLRAVRPRL